MLTFKQLYEAISDDELVFGLVHELDYSFDRAGRTFIDFPPLKSLEPGGAARSISDLLSCGYSNKEIESMIKDRPYTFYWGRTYFHVTEDNTTWLPLRPTLEPLEPGRTYPLERILKVCGPQDIDMSKVTMDKHGRANLPLPPYEPKLGDPPGPRHLLKDLLEAGWHSTPEPVSFSGAGHTYVHLEFEFGAAHTPLLPVDEALVNLPLGWLSFALIYEEVLSVYFSMEHERGTSQDVIWEHRPTEVVVGRELKRRMKKKRSNGTFYLNEDL